MRLPSPLSPPTPAVGRSRRRPAGGRWRPLVALLLVGGCASGYPERPALDPTSVTVIGLTRADGVSGIDRGAAERDLVGRLEDDGRRLVRAPDSARRALGGRAHRALLERHARNGLLDGRDLRLLVNAPLDTRFALLVRVERDEVLELDERVRAARDGGGRALPDRQRVERSTRREMVLSALLVDRLEQRVRWRKPYAASSTTSGESVRYRGSSFSGSVAALVANRLVNGSSGPPPPPGRRETLERLFEEIERSLPGR